MTNAQTWLNENIPLNQRNNIQELYIWPDSCKSEHHLWYYRNTPNKYYISELDKLIGTLDLSMFPQLKELTVKEQSITYLDLSGCCQLEMVNANDNLLIKVIWPKWNLHGLIPSIKVICLTNNDSPGYDLSEFSSFHQLQSLFLGTDDIDRIRQRIYNRWNGSLWHIQSLVDLQNLDINSTDINDGLEYLPTRRLLNFTFGNAGRVGAGVDRFKTMLTQDLRIKFKENCAAEKWAIKGTDDIDSDIDDCLEKMEDIRKWQEKFGRQKLELQAQIQVENPWPPRN